MLFVLLSLCVVVIGDVVFVHVICVVVVRVVVIGVIIGVMK